MSDLYDTQDNTGARLGSPSSFYALLLADLSVAVVFVAIWFPLGAAIREAYRLLDDVAKDGNGRNSLAVAILKPDGLNCQWVTSWEERTLQDSRRASAVELLKHVTEYLEQEASEPGLSSGLVYRIREMLGRVGGWDSWRPGAWGKGLDPRAFLHAEIGHSLAVRGEVGAGTKAGAMTDRVWTLLKHAPAPADDPGSAPKADSGTHAVEFGADALLVARFLARCGQDGYET